MEPNQTWQGIGSAKIKPKTIIGIQNSNQDKVQNAAQAIFDYLTREVKLPVECLEINLTLKQGESDSRLSRGINESGLIRPDFGKPFTGLFFEIIVVKVILNDQNNEEFKNFLKVYLEGVIIHYFIYFGSDYSNWEFSHRNRKASVHSNKAARHVNFPIIQILLD
jgi:hypothetical protein